MAAGTFFAAACANIQQSDRIKAPLTYGVFRPVVLLPKTTDWTNETKLQYILTHEFTHIRRFDALTKLVLAVALCVHGFNPFIWVMYVLANRDIELACDETVVRIFEETMKSAYASMLVCMEETKSGLTPLVNNFKKNAIEERIVSIMKIKKYSRDFDSSREIVDLGRMAALEKIAEIKAKINEFKPN